MSAIGKQQRLGSVNGEAASGTAAACCLRAMQAAQIQVDSAALPACSEIGEMAAVTSPVGGRVVAQGACMWRAVAVGITLGVTGGDTQHV